jgi:hypothetical protein
MDQEVIAAMREVERAEAAAKRNFRVLGRIREYLRRQQTDDNTPISLERAVCHPILGGILRIDPKADVRGPSFTKNSLRLAAEKGDLDTFWNGRFQYVTPAALRAWVTRQGTGKTKVKSPPPIDYRPPAQQTRYEKTLEEAAMDRAADAFASLDVMIARKKNKTKKKGR